MQNNHAIVNCLRYDRQYELVGLANNSIEESALVGLKTIIK